MANPIPLGLQQRPKSGRRAQQVAAAKAAYPKPNPDELFTTPPPQPQPVPNMVEVSGVLKRNKENPMGHGLVDLDKAVYDLVNAVGGNNKTLALLFAYKKLGYDSTTAPEDRVGRLYNFMQTEFTSKEDRVWLMKAWQTLSPALKADADHNLGMRLMKKYPLKVFATAAALQLNFGKSVDWVSCWKAMVEDADVQMYDEKREAQLLGNCKPQYATVVVGDTEITGHVYGRDVTRIKSSKGTYTEKTTPTAAVHACNVIGAELKLDTRRVETLSPDWRHYLHFMVSHLSLSGKSLDFVHIKHGLDMSTEVTRLFAVNQSKHQAVLTWLQSYLGEKIKNGDASVTQLNHVTMIDAIVPQDFYDLLVKLFGDMKTATLELLRKRVKPTGPVADLMEIVLKTPKLGEFYYYPESGPDEIAAKVIDIGHVVFPRTNIPKVRDPLQYPEILEQFERETRNHRENAEFTHDRLWAERFGPLAFLSSTAFKGAASMKKLLEVYKEWMMSGGVENPELGKAFVHVGTTSSNHTDWYKKLHESGLPLFYFDVKPNAQKHISYWDIFHPYFPDSVRDQTKIVFDDTFPLVLGKNPIAFTHSNHNDQNDAIFMALRGLFGNLPKYEKYGTLYNVLAYSKKMFFPVEAKGYKYENFIRQMLEIGKLGKFTHVRIDTANGRIGNSEIFVTWGRFPHPTSNNAMAWGRPVVNLGDEGVTTQKFEEEIGFYEDGFLQTYSYQIAANLLRTAGYCIWGIPHLTWKEADVPVGEICRKPMKVEKVTYDPTQPNAEIFDPLEGFLASLESFYGVQKTMCHGMKEYFKKIYGDHVPQNIKQAVAKLFDVSPQDVGEYIISFEDFMNVWYNTSRWAPNRLYREVLPQLSRRGRRRRGMEGDGYQGLGDKHGIELRTKTSPAEITAEDLDVQELEEVIDGMSIDGDDEGPPVRTTLATFEELKGLAKFDDPDNVMGLKKSDWTFVKPGEQLDIPLDKGKDEEVEELPELEENKSESPPPEEEIDDEIVPEKEDMELEEE